ncbi:hypothetical protein AAES_141795 [Amazona aestiva]|uniref:Uncharacterized protein n=1 Tax=Amazona aestiva TaxID=12930 RepID=A0A0Q3PI49_AMAAE|nr:hypothetical protein AAES_141795 [Amazona aestiva]
MQIHDMMNKLKEEQATREVKMMEEMHAAYQKERKITSVIQNVLQMLQTSLNPCSWLAGHLECGDTQSEEEKLVVRYRVEGPLGPSCAQRDTSLKVMCLFTEETENLVTQLFEVNLVPGIQQMFERDPWPMSLLKRPFTAILSQVEKKN